jgi:hypothetical protein
MEGKKHHFISQQVLKGFPKCSTRIEIPYYVDKDQHSCIWFVKGVKREDD